MAFFVHPTADFFLHPRLAQCAERIQFFDGLMLVAGRFSSSLTATAPGTGRAWQKSMNRSKNENNHRSSVILVGLLVAALGGCENRTVRTSDGGLVTDATCNQALPEGMCASDNDCEAGQRCAGNGRTSYADSADPWPWAIGCYPDPCCRPPSSTTEGVGSATSALVPQGDEPAGAPARAPGCLYCLGVCLAAQCASNDDCIGPDLPGKEPARDRFYCEKAAGCDAPGRCTVRPTTYEQCAFVLLDKGTPGAGMPYPGDPPQGPYCGCDNNDYEGWCAAAMAGTGIAREGSCDVPPDDSCDNVKCALHQDCCSCEAYDMLSSAPPPHCTQVCDQMGCAQGGVLDPEPYCVGGLCLLTDNASGCSGDSDCTLVDDCCSCGAVPGSPVVEHCPSDCEQSMCSALFGASNKVARCVGGHCRVTIE